MVTTYWVIQVCLENSYRSNCLQVPNMNKTPHDSFFFLIIKIVSDYCLDIIVSELEEDFFKWRREAISCYQKSCSLGITIQRWQLRMCFVRVTWTIRRHIIQEQSFLWEAIGTERLEKCAVGDAMTVFLQDISRMKQLEVQIKSF